MKKRRKTSETRRTRKPLRNGTDNVGVLAVARRFARALDRENYDAVEGLLAADCGYQGPVRALLGPEAIVSSYRDQAALARQLFDAVEYHSEIATTGADTACVSFSDHIVSGGRKHVYRCRQLLHFRTDGLIDCIEHEELPEERDRLFRFCAECGVNLDPSA
jgi:SnoaL-like domain